MPVKRKKVLIGGVEFETPADMPMEEIERRHRELTERGERARAESETLDVAAQQRAIAEDLTSDSTRPPEMIAFARALTDASEIAALHRLLADPLTRDEAFEVLRRATDKRLGELVDDA